MTAIAGADTQAGMKNVITAVILAGFCVCAARGEEANGLRLSIQKTVLERETDRDSFLYWEKVEKALALKVSATNLSFKEKPDGTLSYIVIVKRWGSSPTRYERFSGTEAFPLLKAGAKSDLKVGKVPLGGYEGGTNRKQYQDTIEGWQVTVKHGDAETIKVTSTASFDKLNAKAKDAVKP